VRCVAGVPIFTFGLMSGEHGAGCFEPLSRNDPPPPAAVMPPPLDAAAQVPTAGAELGSQATTAGATGDVLGSQSQSTLGAVATPPQPRAPLSPLALGAQQQVVVVEERVVVVADEPAPLPRMLALTAPEAAAVVEAEAPVAEVVEEEAVVEEVVEEVVEAEEKEEAEAEDEAEAAPEEEVEAAAGRKRKKRQPEPAEGRRTSTRHAPPPPPPRRSGRAST